MYFSANSLYCASVNLLQSAPLKFGLSFSSSYVFIAFKTELWATIAVPSGCVSLSLMKREIMRPNACFPVSPFPPSPLVSASSLTLPFRIFSVCCFFNSVWLPLDLSILLPSLGTFSNSCCPSWFPTSAVR